MLPLMKESVPFHQPIIWTGLKNITPMSFSIKIMIHLPFNELMEYRKKNSQTKME